MSDALRGKIALAPASEFRTRLASDRDEIAAFLRMDRLYAAYAIGDLDGPNAGRLAWGVAVDRSGVTRGLAMQHVGLAPQTLFLMGDPAACRAVLATALRPRLAFVQATDAYLPALTELYDLDPPTRLLRMVVDRSSFTPWAGTVQRLQATDVDDLNRLYRLGLGAGFPPSILENGVYFGVRANGRLVAAAGTHAINQREGLAIVGNVMTHADFRGRGFAKAVTSAVTAELLEHVDDVVLNVHATNVPAVAAYSRLGYRAHCDLTEWVAGRRGAGWALTAPLRAAIRWSRANRSDA